MQLYLMRHGSAVNVGSPGVKGDAERTLSPEGIATTTAVARGLAALGVRPECVAASPLVRARQTAELVARETGSAGPIEVCESLAPGAATADVIGWLRAIRTGSVVMVGHMPEIATLASELVAGHPNAAIIFKKAAVCCIVFDGAPASACGHLEWLVPPEHLRLLQTPHSARSV